MPRTGVDSFESATDRIARVPWWEPSHGLGLGRYGRRCPPGNVLETRQPRGAAIVSSLAIRTAFAGPHLTYWSGRAGSPIGPIWRVTREGDDDGTGTGRAPPRRHPVATVTPPNRHAHAILSGVPKDRVPPGSQTSLREANRARIIEAVQQRGAITQVELVGVTGLSAATISNIVKELTAAGVLNTAPTSRSGRRAQMVSLARNLGLVVGVHFAERSLRAVLADVTQRVVAEQRLPLPPDHRADSGLDRVALLIEEMVDSLGASMAEVLAVGVGIPAPVDATTGMVSALGILRGWDWVPVPQVLGDRLGVPVRVENDANLGALAEHRIGAAIGTSNLIYLRASYGLGLGIIIDGRIVHGRSGMAGELGHMILDPAGVPCRCGRRGCLETVAGAGALVGAMQGERGHVALRDVVTQALEGDEVPTMALADVGRSLGRHLALVTTLLDPEQVVIGGELARAGELLLGPLREALEAAALHGTAGPVPVVAGALGEQSEARGAVALAVEASRVVVPGGGGR